MAAPVPKIEDFMAWKLPALQLASTAGQVQSVSMSSLPLHKASASMASPTTGRVAGVKRSSAAIEVDQSRDWYRQRIGNDPAIRLPEFYDMHMNPALRIIHFKSFQNLPDLLAKHADMMVAQTTASHTVATFPNDPLSFDLYRRQFLRPTPVSRQSDITDAYRYRDTVSTRLTAGLVAPGPQQWKELEYFLKFTTTSPPSSVARAPGYMYIDNSAIPKSLETSDPTLYEGLGLVHKYELSHIVVYNFKCVGDPFPYQDDFLFVLQYLARGATQLPLVWHACDESQEMGEDQCFSQWCKVKHNGRPSITGRKTTNDSDLVLGLLSQAIPAPPMAALEFNQKLITKVSYVVQEMCAAAISKDATFVVFSTGNKEVIAIRERGNQTFHFSDILDISRNPSSGTPPIPSHFKVHAGLGGVGITDAVDRAVDIQQRQENGTLPALFLDEPDFDGLSPEHLFRSYGVSAGEQLPPETRRMSAEELAEKLKAISAVYINWDTTRIHIPGLHTSPQCVLQQGMRNSGNTARITLQARLRDSVNSYLAVLEDPLTTLPSPVKGALVVKVVVGTREDIATRDREVLVLKKGYSSDGGLLPFRVMPVCYGGMFGARLQHNQVVQVIFLEHFPLRPVLALSKAPGEKFEANIKRWLTHIHSKGIVHRDLQIGNILCDADAMEKFCVVNWKSSQYYEKSERLSDFGQEQLLDEANLKAIIKMLREISDRKQLRR